MFLRNAWLRSFWQIGKRGASNMPLQYVEKVADAYRLVGSRISLESIVYAYWNGQTVESIGQSFPGLTLEQIHGALAFYLAHRSEVDE
jgi:uncharacterized protein (DUF433 family)